MARIYQTKEARKIIPPNLYMAIIYLMRDYGRQKEVAGDYLHSKRGGRKNPTERKAVKLVELEKLCDIIDASMETIEEEYRDGVWNNIVWGKPYPDDARRTWVRKKIKVIKAIGIGLGWLREEE